MLLMIIMVRMAGPVVRKMDNDDSVDARPSRDGRDRYSPPETVNLTFGAIDG